MTYEKFIKKYEGKRRAVVFISCFFFLMFIAAVIAAAVFIPGFIAKGGPSVPTLLIVLPVGAVIILIGFLLLTVAGMAVIVFIGVLFYTLLEQLITFFSTLYVEIVFRM